MFFIDAKMKRNKPKIPHKLMISALLSAGLAIILSLATILLCMLAFVYRYHCPVAEPPTNGAEYFIITLIKVYILNTECKYSLQTHDLTKSDSIFIFVIILTIFCLIHVFSAIGMVKVITQEEPSKCMDISIYIYIGASLAVLVVDLTLSVHFGIDYAKMKHELSLNSAALAMNYEMDVIRLGSLLLMSVALKGYVGHAANMVLLLLLIIYVNQYRRSLHQVQHSIHKMGPLNSFGVPRAFLKPDESWSPRSNDIFLTYTKSESSNQQVNIDNGPEHVTRRDLNYISSTPEYNEGEPTRQRGPIKKNPISNRNYDRSTSWLPDSGARPFSYLEVPKQLAPVKATRIPADDPHWRRDLWLQGPSVPDPDYSPPPRRLKSVLKSNFI